MSPIPRARSRGFAVILAIAVAATVASVATFLAWNGTLNFRQIENIASARQSGALVHAASAWAAATLLQDDSRVDYRGEAWARGMPPIDIDGVRVDATISDEQGKFNLNNLADANGSRAADVAAFRRLLVHVGLSESLADAVVDWIDVDSNVTAADSGAEDSYYLGLDPPYRAANRPMVDVTELLLVRGFNEERFRRLAPYVTALPVATKVNVNTASAELLSAVVKGLTQSDARSVVAARDKEPFGSKADFGKRLPEPAIDSANELLDVRTDYFLVRGTVQSGRAAAGYRALLWRVGPTVLSLTRTLG
jgi:general secretion pathway protein K